MAIGLLEPNRAGGVVTYMGGVSGWSAPPQYNAKGQQVAPRKANAAGLPAAGWLNPDTHTPRAPAAGKKRARAVVVAVGAAAALYLLWRAF